MGYGRCEKGYKLFNFKTKKVILYRDVVFKESANWDWDKQVESNVYIPLSLEDQETNAEFEGEHFSENGPVTPV